MMPVSAVIAIYLVAITRAIVNITATNSIFQPGPWACCPGPGFLLETIMDTKKTVMHQSKITHESKMQFAGKAQMLNLTLTQATQVAIDLFLLDCFHVVDGHPVPK